MYQGVLEKVLMKYDIGFVDIFHHQKGYRNEIWPIEIDDGQMINVTFFKREPGSLERILRADAVSEYLASKGMPTRRRFDKRTMQLKGSRGETNVAVYTYLPGDTIPWEAYTMKHMKQLGQTMSDMHAHLADMSMNDIPSVYDEYLAVIDRMQVYFTKPQVVEAVGQKLDMQLEIRFDLYRRLLEQCDTLLSHQVLHMDFVRGNILFKDDEVSGILDFEKTAIGSPVVDIARTLAFLLVDCKYKSQDKVYKYFLYSGYKKRGAAKNIGDVKTRELLIELFLLYDFYKFLRHNPYESLYANEHYTRTRDMLIERSVIKYKQ